MGSLAAEPFASFIQQLVQQEGYRNFVETGTYVGETTLWASHVFSKVCTVDINHEFQAQAKQNCLGRDNITFFTGRSENCMPKMLATINGPAIFWLDAHAGGGWYAKKDDCPLIDELDLLALRGVNDDIVLIDDARGFLAPPPPPFDVDAWPPIHAVLNAADPQRERYIVIIEDVVICAPPRLKNTIIAFCNRARPTI